MGGPWRAERAGQRLRYFASRPADGYGPPIGRPLQASIESATLAPTQLG